ncbi:hypothetical protein Tco_0449939 [Tanacetum coccineum]
MSSTSAHKQAHADVGSETCPPMLERLSSYQKKVIPATTTQPERPQTEDDFTSDDLKHYEADMKAMNLILMSIPKNIYNFVDASENARDIWNIVKRLMQGTELSKTEREPRFVNEFDKFTAELRESLSSVYNRFSQLTNDMDRNKVKPFDVTINTKFLNCL